MPIYEYACTECHHRFEILQRLRGKSGDGLSCPKCGHAHVTKQFSTFAGVAAGGKGASAADAGCGESNCCRTSSAFG